MGLRSRAGIKMLRVALLALILSCSSTPSNSSKNFFTPLKALEKTYPQLIGLPFIFTDAQGDPNYAVQFKSSQKFKNPRSTLLIFETQGPLPSLSHEFGHWMAKNHWEAREFKKFFEKGGVLLFIPYHPTSIDWAQIKSFLHKRFRQNYQFDSILSYQCCGNNLATPFFSLDHKLSSLQKKRYQRALNALPFTQTPSASKDTFSDTQVIDELTLTYGPLAFVLQRKEARDDFTEALELWRKIIHFQRDDESP